METVTSVDLRLVSHGAEEPSAAAVQDQHLGKCLYFHLIYKQTVFQHKTDYFSKAVTQHWCEMIRTGSDDGLYPSILKNFDIG